MKYWNNRLFDDGKDYCTWVFRPGYDGIHFAKARCDGDFKELSIRIRDPKPGCADWYNGRRCPVCKRPIRMDYWIIEEQKYAVVAQFGRAPAFQAGCCGFKARRSLQEPYAGS